MLKIITINIKQIKNSDRLEPDFWVLGNFIDLILKAYTHKFLNEYSKFIKKGIFDLKAERYKTEGIPFLRISNLKYFEMGTEDLVFISDDDNKNNCKTILRHGDIAFSKIGTLGKLLRVGMRYPEVNLSQNLIGVALKKEINKNYVFAYLLSKLALIQIKKNKKKQLQDKLNLDDIKNIQVVELSEIKIKQISDLVESAELKSEHALALINKAQVIIIKAIDIDFTLIKKEKTFSANLLDFILADLWTPNYSLPLYKNTLKAIQTKWETVL